MYVPRTKGFAVNISTLFLHNLIPKTLGIATSSGLGATTLLTHLLKSGDHIVCGDDVYGGKRLLL